jgi:cystathionine beta-lyase/cystathionine gamma-synthase
MRKQMNKKIDQDPRIRDKEMPPNVGERTMLAHHGENRQQHQGAVVPPIYQNSLFTFPDLESIDRAFDDPVNHYIYGRGNNPSVATAEAKIAKLCAGERAKLFTSGMAAISAGILHCVRANSHIVTLKSVYGPTNNLINRYLKRFDISCTFVSGIDLEEVRDAFQENTSLIYLESPSSLLFTLQDIQGIAALARERGIKTIIDNTWATPQFQKPLQMGVDLEVHSCSKYLGGHSDIVAGVLIGGEKDIQKIFLEEHALLGGKTSPFEGWLLLRSLRTFPLRMKQHQENAFRVAEFLDTHEKVSKVFYPGLKSFPQYELGARQMTGYSGLMSFSLNTTRPESIGHFVNSLKLFQIGVSWGGHESLVYTPGLSYSKELPPDQFAALGITRGLIRISVGLENVEDLIADLEKSLSDL